METPGRGTVIPATAMGVTLAVHLPSVPPSLQVVSVSASTPSVEQTSSLGTQTSLAAEAKALALVVLSPSAMWTAALTAGTRSQPRAGEGATPLWPVTLVLLTTLLVDSYKAKA